MGYQGHKNRNHWAIWTDLSNDKAKAGSMRYCIKYSKNQKDAVDMLMGFLPERTADGVKFSKAGLLAALKLFQDYNMGVRLADISVTPVDSENPYTSYVSNEERVSALCDWAHGAPEADSYAFWYAPSEGGARRLGTVAELDLEDRDYLRQKFPR